jgi:hypothetical protein
MESEHLMTPTKTAHSHSHSHSHGDHDNEALGEHGDLDMDEFSGVNQAKRIYLSIRIFLIGFS